MFTKSNQYTSQSSMEDEFESFKLTNMDINHVNRRKYTIEQTQVEIHAKPSMLSDTSSEDSLTEDLSFLSNTKEKMYEDRMKDIVSQFRSRALNIRKILVQPITPDKSSSESSVFSTHQNEHLVFEAFDSCSYNSKSTINYTSNTISMSQMFRRLEFIDPRGYINISWLFIQALIFMYNAWSIPYRSVFPNFTSAYWWLADYIGDFVYLLDLLFYKPRVLYMDNGFWIKDKKRLHRHYIKQGSFKVDVMALLPFDLLYFWFGTDFVFIRLPRLIKVYAYWECIERLDSVLAKPYFLRIFKTANSMLYLIHLNACAYFYLSTWIGIGSNDFVYDGRGSPYIRCFYFATKTATSIGKNNKPTSIPEILFMTASWLLGVFVFAILIGDIRDIVGTARRNISVYQLQLDAISLYMNKNKVNKSIQRRVKTWLNYTWAQQKTLDESSLLAFLPSKLRTDIAMRVHYKTLSKVKIFRNCDPGLLKDLVVMLRPVIYLDGDYICKKNDKGTEMYIIQSGQVQVLGGNQNVLVTLTQGSVFGEIALLGVNGMNRRTADVVSKGFSTIFLLQKNDLETVLTDYPEAQRILNARARRLIKENEARDAAAESAMFFQQKNYDQPALLNTVFTLLPETSKHFIKKTNKIPHKSLLTKSMNELRSEKCSSFVSSLHTSCQSLQDERLTANKIRNQNYSNFSLPYTLLIDSCNDSYDKEIRNNKEKPQEVCDL